MLIKKKRVQILGMLLLAGILSAPLSACSRTMDPKSIAKPPVATTNERGQKDPDKVDWGALETEPEELTEAAKTLRDLDMGYFVGAPDILNAYYMFDNPQKYYSDWPTVGLHFPTDEEYNSSPAAYKDIISLIEGLDQSQLDESQIREVKDMLFDFTAYEKLYENWIYAPQLNPMGGKQMTYPLLTSLIQFQSKADVERYFLILGDYYTFFSRAVEVEKMRSEKGIGWNDENLDRIIADCQRMQENRDTHFLKTTFESRLGALHLSDQETADYMKKNQELLDTVYFPTMEMLIEKLQELKGLCNDEPYLAETVEGKAYYEALFAFRSGVSYTVDECKDMLQAEIDRIYEEYEPRWRSSGSYFAFGNLSFEEACEWCQRFMQDHFPQIQSNSVSIYEIPSEFSDSIQPARYYTSPIDNVTKHSVWINKGLVDNPEYDMFTLVAHEMYPGHLFQHQYQAEILNNKYQVFATGVPYAEGWAQYAERLMIRYAPFDQVQADNAWTASILYSSYIAARLSIGVEYEGWDYDRCLTYLEKYGQDKEVLDQYWKNLTATQCYGVEYAFGFYFTDKILQNAVKELDGICTEDEVIEAYLALGCAPFEVLEEDMEAFIRSKKG